MGPGAAQLRLALHTQMLVTGNPSLTTESGMSIANTILSLWQAGYYTPGSAYPYTLEETLQDIQQGLKAKETMLTFSNRLLLPRMIRREDYARWRQGSSNIPGL